MLPLATGVCPVDAMVVMATTWCLLTCVDVQETWAFVVLVSDAINVPIQTDAARCSHHLFMIQKHVCNQPQMCCTNIKTQQ